MGDRPAQDEIEVTPRMIEEGGAAFLCADTRFETVEEIAAAIYRAMELVRRMESVSSVVSPTGPREPTPAAQKYPPSSR